MNITNLIQTAFEHQNKGNVKQAESLYKEILRVQPDNASVNYNLGIICQDELRFDESIYYYKEALRINPNLHDAYFNLGAIFHSRGSFGDAIENYHNALKLDPNSADIHNNLGLSLKAKGEIDQAIFHFRKALDLDPDFESACSNLGILLMTTGQYTDGIHYLQQALQLNPQAMAYHNLGIALQGKKQLDEAISCYKQALQLAPDFIDTYIHLGDAYRVKGLLHNAAVYLQQALTLNQNSFIAYNILGLVTQEQGKIEEAEKYFRHALQLNPDFSVCYSNLLFLMNYHPTYDASFLFREHLNFAKRFEEPLSAVISNYSNNKSPARRLKIGYVSPDFRRHSVASFIEPVLAAHDRQWFEVFCYSDTLGIDETTNRIRGYADEWRPIAGLPDENVRALVRQDNIDILVDLAGHTGYNRMILFAQKAAPVQVTWIGYPATTGLSVMDYKIVDTYTDPPGMTESYYTEKLIRMPESFLCYLPPKDSPEAGDPAAHTRRHITFGSFNNFKKISTKMLRLWTSILKELPDTRLIMKSFSFSDEITRSYAHKFFISEGIAADRVECLPPVPSMRDHLTVYNYIDIGLDTFPYNGTTTTCEALWMGVPVITLAGETHASRVGTSLLSNVGLPEMITTTSEEYIQKALELAGNKEKLQSLRIHLRDMMLCSPLTDAHKFTVHLEEAYRKIWTKWCGNNS